MSRNTPVNVTFAGWTARWSTSWRVPKVSELRYSSDSSPLTSVCPSVPPPLPSTAKAKSPRAPTRSAEAPFAPPRLPRSTQFGVSSLPIDLGVHTGVIRPRVQVPTGERDAGALGVELSSHRLRQVVRDGQLAQLDEPPRLDEPERSPLGG